MVKAKKIATTMPGNPNANPKNKTNFTSPHPIPLPLVIIINMAKKSDTTAAERNANNAGSKDLDTTVDKR